MTEGNCIFLGHIRFQLPAYSDQYLASAFFCDFEDDIDKKPSRSGALTVTTIPPRNDCNYDSISYDISPDNVIL
jgi:hypothetical protein